MLIIYPKANSSSGLLIRDDWTLLSVIRRAYVCSPNRLPNPEMSCINNEWRKAIYYPNRIKT